MKILFFIDSLNAGGKERRFTELLKGLKNFPGVSFEVAVMSESIHYKEIFNLNTRIHYLIRKSKKDFSILIKLYKLCKTFDPDIIHCWDSMTAVYSTPICKLLNIKLVNGMVIETPVKRNFFSREYRRARLTFPFSDRIIGNSFAGLKAFKAGAKKSLCIYNGIDFNRFMNLPNPEDVKKEIFRNNFNDIFIVGMVAAFEDRKDYFTLIEAAKIILRKEKSVRFILVGDGANLNKIMELVPIDIKENIFFMGKRNDVESIVQLFDVGILLTNSKVHGEGVSNSIIEYMSLSKAVIATSGGGTDEVVLNNENGFLIDPGNSLQLVDRIELLMKDKDTKVRLGKRGRHLAHQRFDLDNMTKSYINVYISLIKKPK